MPQPQQVQLQWCDLDTDSDEGFCSDEDETEINAKVLNYFIWFLRWRAYMHIECTQYWEDIVKT